MELQNSINEIENIVESLSKRLHKAEQTLELEDRIFLT
jgi:hypothetical protein